MTEVELDKTRSIDIYRDMFVRNDDIYEVRMVGDKNACNSFVCTTESKAFSKSM